MDFGIAKRCLMSIIMGFQNSIEPPLIHLPVVAFHTNQKYLITCINLDIKFKKSFSPNPRIESKNSKYPGPEVQALDFP